MSIDLLRAASDVTVHRDIHFLLHTSCLHPLIVALTPLLSHSTSVSDHTYICQLFFFFYTAELLCWHSTLVCVCVALGAKVQPGCNIQLHVPHKHKEANIRGCKKNEKPQLGFGFVKGRLLALRHSMMSGRLIRLHPRAVYCTHHWANSTTGNKRY